MPKLCSEVSLALLEGMISELNTERYKDGLETQLLHRAHSHTLNPEGLAGEINTARLGWAPGTSTRS